MFSGIVEEVGKVISIKTGKLVLAANRILEGIEIGDSIAVNGACLTIVDLNANSLSVDIMPETLRRTNIKLFSAGDGVNLERSMTLGGRIGGHLVQGHVDATGRISSIIREKDATILRIESSPDLMCYIVDKGFIAIDGSSLTIVTKNTHSFQVSIVAYTYKHTTISNRRLGDLVNLEVDIIAKYVKQLGQVHPAGITLDFLQEHGFLVN